MKLNINSKYKLWIIITVSVLLVGFTLLAIFGFNQTPDYKTSKEVCFDASGDAVEEKTIFLPASDVLYYTYPDFWFCLRPSGTEPKVKVYFGAGGQDRMEAQVNVLKVKEAVMEKLNTFLD